MEAELLYPKYHRLVRDIIRKQGFFPREIEDMSQDIWVQILKSIHSYRGEAKLSGWIAGVAVNVCRDRRRQESTKFRKAVEFVNWDTVWIDECEEAGVEGDQGVVDLLDTLMRSGINRHQFEVVMRTAKGYSLKEIAEDLDETVEGVKSCIYRIRKRLRPIVQW